MYRLTRRDCDGQLSRLHFVYLPTCDWWCCIVERISRFRGLSPRKSVSTREVHNPSGKNEKPIDWYVGLMKHTTKYMSMVYIGPHFHVVVCGETESSENTLDGENGGSEEVG